MIIEHSQDRVIIDIPKKFKRIGLKLSGGADSAILCYLLFKYMAEERNECILLPITANQELHSYNYELSEMIVEFCKKQFPSVNVGQHFKCQQRVEETDIITHQKIFLRTLRENNLMDCHFIGLTTNPVEGFKDNTPSDITRMMNRERISGTSFRPLTNIDKKGIYELYKKFNLIDSLFLITRSCDDKSAKTHLSHCGNCFPCRERRWGFGSAKNKFDLVLEN